MLLFFFHLGQSNCVILHEIYSPFLAQLIPLKFRNVILAVTWQL